MNLEAVVLELPNDLLLEFSCLLDAANAKKYNLLLHAIRNQKSTEFQLKELSPNKTAYYVLRSRLYDRLQDFLFLKYYENSKCPDVSILDDLFLNNNKEIAECIFLKMESMLLLAQDFEKLIPLYRLILKYAVYTNKYNDYAYKYKKALHNLFCINKTEDAFIEFNQLLSDYFITKNEKTLRQLSAIILVINKNYKKTGLKRIKILFYLTEIQLYISFSIESQNIENVLYHDLFNEIDDYQLSNSIYDRFLPWSSCLDIIKFEWFVKIDRLNKSKEYLEKLIEKNSIVISFSSIIFRSNFYVSVIKYQLKTNNEKELIHIFNKIGCSRYINNKVDLYVFNLFHALSLFYDKRFDEASKILITFQNDCNYKEYLVIDIEIKLLLALFEILNKKDDLAKFNIRNVARKITLHNRAGAFENYKTILKILKTSLSNKGPSHKQKLITKYLDVLNLNKSSSYFFEILFLDHHIVSELSKK